MFGQTTIVEVEPGTVVGQDQYGHDMVVSDTSAVMDVNTIWVTPKVYAALKAVSVPTKTGGGA